MVSVYIIYIYIPTVYFLQYGLFTMYYTYDIPHSHSDIDTKLKIGMLDKKIAKEKSEITIKVCCVVN